MGSGQADCIVSKPTWTQGFCHIIPSRPAETWYSVIGGARAIPTVEPNVASAYTTINPTAIQDWTPSATVPSCSSAFVLL